ncbi:hypothetical protein [Streptomyces hygroscopicus]|uniref:hypothetical protein n=1 Tax=Streptomyces hygroscopicus TaxID=1912 RepID=UPI0036B52025
MPSRVPGLPHLMPGDAAGRPPGDGPRWAAGAFLTAMGPALTVLAAVAAAGALPVTGLPGGTPGAATENP